MRGGIESCSRRELIEAAGAAFAVYMASPFGRAQSSLQTRGSSGGGEKLDDTVVVPAGKFLMGTTPEEAQQLADAYGYHVSWLDGEVPQREVFLPTFRIDRYPVTVAKYALFCQATGHTQPAYWRTLDEPAAWLQHPVREVNWISAQAYAAWIGKRLPTEEEWEKAARGTDGRTFPWGNRFDPDACRWNRYGTAAGHDTAAVGTHGTGDSPYGVTDMSGNVAEWCADGPSDAVRYVKGGGWYTEQVLNLRPACRNMSCFLNYAGLQFGFRCAEDGP